MDESDLRVWKFKSERSSCSAALRENRSSPKWGWVATDQWPTSILSEWKTVLPVKMQTILTNKYRPASLCFSSGTHLSMPGYQVSTPWRWQANIWEGAIRKNVYLFRAFCLILTLTACYVCVSWPLLHSPYGARKLWYLTSLKLWFYRGSNIRRAHGKHMHAAVAVKSYQPQRRPLMSGPF